MAKKSKVKLALRNEERRVLAPALSLSQTTPTSSSDPSAYASDDEDEIIQPAKFDVSTIPIHQLSLSNSSYRPPPIKIISASTASEGRIAGTLTMTPDSGSAELVSPSKGKAPVKPFPFLFLPSELRIKVYKYHFEGTDPVADLTPENYNRVYKKLFLLRTCRVIYMEASHLFYSTRTIRIFPTYPGRLFKTKRPLLARLSTLQRSTLTSMELRLGPGFNKPPRGWVVNKALGLKECINVRKLNVFVQLDPSVSWLDGFRKEGFYEDFSCNLLDDILKQAPCIEIVEFDAYESVRKGSPIIEALVHTTHAHGKRIAWGPKNGWTEEGDSEANKAANARVPVDLNRPIVGTMINYENPIIAGA